MKWIPDELMQKLRVMTDDANTCYVIYYQYRYEKDDDNDLAKRVFWLFKHHDCTATLTEADTILATPVIKLVDGHE